MTDSQIVEKYSYIIGTGIVVMSVFPHINEQVVREAKQRIEQSEINDKLAKVIKSLPVNENYTPEEVMKKTGQGKTKIYEALKSGMLVGSKNAGSSKWNITPEALRDYENL